MLCHCDQKSGRSDLRAQLLQLPGMPLMMFFSEVNSENWTSHRLATEFP